ncbi:MAG: matrixin family metalloprotease, partial [Pseudobdellovibrionaceae bacterium]
DYNSIYNSSLILALDSDPDFAANSLDRRIIIEEGEASGVSSGEARQTFRNRYIIGCEVTLTDVAYESAKGYVALLSHELGHCMGLDHPQSTVWSVMSYFYNTDEVYRLAIDDKMGIVHLYGATAGNRDEKPTGGLSCSNR